MTYVYGKVNTCIYVLKSFLSVHIDMNLLIITSATLNLLITIDDVGHVQVRVNTRIYVILLSSRIKTVIKR